MQTVLFAIVEVGSTNTKGYYINKTDIEEVFFRNINFKKNYIKSGDILSEDIKMLIELILNLKKQTNNIFVYGTSVFRELSKEKVTALKQEVKEQTNADFEIVKQKEENELTVLGAISKCSVDYDIGILVGGGGSTEISICRAGDIVEQANSNFGVSDVMKQFPELAYNTTKTNISDVQKFIKSNLNLPKNKGEILILTGGGFLIRYMNAKYPIMLNTLYYDSKQPYMVSYHSNKEYDSLYYKKIALNTLRKFTPDNPRWWDGTRAMCGFVNTVAEEINAKYVIPTNLTMVDGIAEHLRKHY